MKEKLTPKDIEKIQAEIDHRKLVLRPQILDAVREARAQGDLSENFEYYAAKKAKNRNESRIRYLERMIRTAQIISDESADDEVGLNKTVELYFEDDDETEKFKVVTTVRGSSLEGYISNESPIGKAVIGHKVGERVYVEVNSGVGYYVVIKSIEDTGDADEAELKKY